MKNFVITTGAILLAISIMSFQLTCNNLLRQKQQLKFAAEEAAAVAGMCLQENGSDEGGDILIRQEEASAKANHIVEKNLKTEDFSLKLEFYSENEEKLRVHVILKKDKMKTEAVYSASMKKQI